MSYTNAPVVVRAGGESLARRRRHNCRYALAAPARDRAIWRGGGRQSARCRLHRVERALPRAGFLLGVLGWRTRRVSRTDAGDAIDRCRARMGTRAFGPREDSPKLGYGALLRGRFGAD